MSDRGKPAGIKRFAAVLLLAALIVIPNVVFGLAAALTDIVRTYRDIGVFPGEKLERVEIKGEIPPSFSREDMELAAKAAAEFSDKCKMTLLSVEYACGLEDHLESSCPESPDNCRMVLRCCEYNYGDDAANIPVHSRHCPFAVLVRDDEASPWRVTEHGYI